MAPSSDPDTFLLAGRVKYVFLVHDSNVFHAGNGATVYVFPLLDFATRNCDANLLVMCRYWSPSSAEGSISLPSCHSFQLVMITQSGSAVIAFSHIIR
jgi:hypothetical protein